MYFRILTLAVLTVSLLGSTASAQLSNFFEDFESLDRTDAAALSNAGWLGAAAGIPDGGGFQFFAGFAAGNDIANPVNSVISDVPSGGAPPVGNQGLVVFTDFNSSIHTDQPNSGFEDLVISIFQERTLVAADIGSTVEFSWIADGNAVPPSADTLAEAFILTLDPNNGFAATNALAVDTTLTADGALAAGSITLDLTDPALDGQIFQFGFRTTSSSGNGAAVDYDNVALTVNSVPEPSSLMALAMGSVAMIARRRRKS